MIVRFKLKTSLRVYTVITKISRDRETLEVDVYDGEPYFRDGTLKYLNEASWIGGYDDEPFTHSLKPIDLAKKVVEDYERAERLENYLRLKHHFIHYHEEEKQKQEETQAEIYDFEDASAQNYIKYLIQNPHEVDNLEEKERKRLLKENLELRVKYREWMWLEKEHGRGTSNV